MAWIESHQELRDHPKTKRAARMLGIGIPQMIGHMQCLWWWSIDYAEDGDLSRFDAFDVADAAGWEDDPDAFVDALIECGPGDSAGFLNTDWTLHDWGDYAGKLISQRESNRERQRRFREKKAATRDEPSLEKPRNGNVTRDKPVSNGATLQYPTLPNRTEEEKDGGSAPNGSHQPPAEEIPDLTKLEQHLAHRVREIRGMANVSAAEIVLHVRECLDNRGSPPSEFTMRSEFQKFRDYWQDKRKNQPSNRKWSGWKRALTNWMSKIPDEPEEPAMARMDAMYPEWQMSDE